MTVSDEKPIALRVQRPQRRRHRGEGHDGRERDRHHPEPEAVAAGCESEVGVGHRDSQDHARVDRDQRRTMLTVIAFGDKLRGVELRQLATFVAVAEEGSFTRASDRLHVVQSAVSAGVRKLERELGAMLFDRSTHSVELTDAGRALLPEARATLAAAQAARDAVDEVRGGVRGTVALGTMQAQGMRAIDLAARAGRVPRRASRGRGEASVTPAAPARWPARSATDAWTSRSSHCPATARPASSSIPLAREPIMLAVPAGHPLAAARRHRPRGAPRRRRWSTSRQDGASGWPSTAPSPPPA